MRGKKTKKKKYHIVIVTTTKTVDFQSEKNSKGAGKKEINFWEKKFFFFGSACYGCIWICRQPGRKKEGKKRN